MFSRDEMCRIYRMSKKKSRQIEIFCQTNLMTRAQVLAELEAGGISWRELPRKSRKSSGDTASTPEPIDKQASDPTPECEIKQETQAEPAPERMETMKLKEDVKDIDLEGCPLRPTAELAPNETETDRPFSGTVFQCCIRDDCAAYYHGTCQLFHTVVEVQG